MPPLRISKKTFKDHHRRLNRRLNDFSLTKRGREVVTTQIKKNQQLASALSLKAINYAARVRYAERLVKGLGEIIARRVPIEILFVTLIMREHAAPYRRAAKFDVKECKAAAKSLLEGFNYVGFVEPAFYYRAPFVANGTGAFISWHVHAIVWCQALGELAARRRLFNRRYHAFVPGRRAAHYKKIPQDRLSSYTRYMSKNVLKEYTAYPKMREIIDLQTGEIFKQPTGKWINRKRDIRPSNLVRAMTVVGNRTLKQLSFAGGAGSLIRTEALIATRQSLRRDAVARDAETKKLLFGS